MMLRCIALLIVVSASAADVGRQVSLIVGKGELIQFGNDLIKVVVAEPKIADAVVVSPRDVMVTAKSVGHTTLVIWETGSSPVRYEIAVVTDTSELDHMHATLAGELKAALPDASVQFSGNAETLVLTGKAGSGDQSKKAEAIASAHSKKVVNMIQVPPAAEPRQIMLSVKFASVDRTALSQLGFNLFSRNGVTIGSTSTQQFTGPLFSQLNNGGTPAANVSNPLNLFLYRPDLGIGLTLQALLQQNLAQILAEPNLIVLEGSEASFLAGGQFPYPTITSTPTGSGIAPVVTIQFKKYGVQLNFTPTITSSGAINLKVKPEVSTLDYTNAVTVDGFQIPALSSRSAETEVNLRDGESFAIAGLIDNRVTQILNKVPGLGDIPILGQLFRSRSTEKTSTELVVVVTPHFVKPLPASDKPKMPDIVVPFLPSVEERKAAKDNKDKKKPEFVGPRGHQVPNL
jgi:pilus assembly protein CpaC